MYNDPLTREPSCRKIMSTQSNEMSPKRLIYRFCARLLLKIILQVCDFRVSVCNFSIRIDYKIQRNNIIPTQ